MTPEERIEAAARQDSKFYDEYPPQVQKMARDIAGKILRAGYPELHGDVPSHWLAPWDLTNELKSVGRRAILDDVFGTEPEAAWFAMRSAYLAKEKGE